MEIYISFSMSYDWCKMQNEAVSIAKQFNKIELAGTGAGFNQRDLWFSYTDKVEAKKFIKAVRKHFKGKTVEARISKETAKPIKVVKK